MARSLPGRQSRLDQRAAGADHGRFDQPTERGGKHQRSLTLRPRIVALLGTKSSVLGPRSRSRLVGPSWPAWKA
eukprot:7856334-Alexandrium_andersonii.AAC.1